MKKIIHITMNEELAKLWLINWSAIIVSMQDIDDVLRILLLVASIIYTFIKIVRMIKNDKTHDD